jgi:hypothetical protein
LQSKLAKGVREGKPENVIWILKWVGESPPTYVLPARIAECRYANGATPEGTLVDITERCRLLREGGSPSPSTDEVLGCVECHRQTYPRRGVSVSAVSLFTPVLTGHTEKDESFAETGHNAGTNISLQ